MKTNKTIIYEKEKAPAIYRKVMEAYKLNYLTIEKWRDKYGMVEYLKEIGVEYFAKDKELAISDILGQHDFIHSEKALELLKEVEKKDNEVANLRGLKNYKIIGLFENKSFIRCGVILKFDDGSIRYHITTGLHYALYNEKELRQFIDRRQKNKFIAGGLKENECDYIFNGIDFSSSHDLYSARKDLILDF